MDGLIGSRQNAAGVGPFSSWKSCSGPKRGDTAGCIIHHPLVGAILLAFPSNIGIGNLKHRGVCWHCRSPWYGGERRRMFSEAARQAE